MLDSGSMCNTSGFLCFLWVFIWEKAGKYQLLSGRRQSATAYGVHISALNKTKRMWGYCPATLRKGDCLDLMKDIPDKSIDLILTDPPYGIKADKGSAGFGVAKGRRYKGNWDAKIPPKEVFEEMFRIGKNVIIFGGNYFAHYLPPSKHWIVWDKKGDIAFKNPFADCELIYTSFNRVVKKIVFRQQGFITDSKDKRVHPTQKPTELIEILLREYTKENDIVLDCYMGSGSVGVSCVRTKRRFVGIELDDKYYEIAQQRINNAAFSLQ